MTFKKLNHWLTLTTNLEVIGGIFFLALEAHQSNQALEHSNSIAVYTSENARRNQFMQINLAMINNSEIMAKLQSIDSELTEIEKTQALHIARMLANSWLDAESAFKQGLLSEETFNEMLLDVSVITDESPGLIPFYAYLIKAYQWEKSISKVFKKLRGIVKDAGH